MQLRLQKRSFRKAANRMSVRDSECFERFVRLCEDAFAQGWHEANGGNLSYRMSAWDIVACGDDFCEGETWHRLSRAYPALAGDHVIVTGSGKHLRNAALDSKATFGVIELDEQGAAWRRVWGLEGGRPSSELETHLAAYEAAEHAGDGASRVIYHAHCPNVIALSTVLDADIRTWTRALWQCMTESIIVFPKGIGVIAWKVPGSSELASITCELMKTYKVCVWTQHGIMVRAADFDEAFGLAHTVEKSAGIYLQARAACGGVPPKHLVSDEQLRAVCARYGLEPNEAFLD